MNTTNTRKKGDKCPDYTHILPKHLADYLHTRGEEKYSKFEAFRYLMERQAVQKLNPSENRTGAFTVTVTQLSEDWGWHRHCVSAFLDNLSKLGYLTQEKHSHSSVLLLTKLEIQGL